MQFLIIDLLGGDGAHISKDAFGFSLSYFNQDYKPRHTTGTQLNDLSENFPNSNGAALYNGNINKMITSVRGVKEEALPSQINLYSYDQLNRIFEMTSEKIVATSNGLASSPSYSTAYSYDRNGNLETLERYAPKKNISTGVESIVEMDKFTYHYTPSTNQLTHVNDVVPNEVFGNVDDNYASIDIDNQPSNNYQYDDIGQLISDQAEGISLIEWRVDGKVKSITKTGAQPSIRFYYDGLGNRVAKKIMNDPLNGTATHYTRDAQGNVMAAYKVGISANEVFENNLEEHHIYGSSRLGIQNYTHYDVPQNYHRLVGDKRYELSNHLGNVLSVVNDRKIVDSSVETIHTNFFDTEKWIRVLTASVAISPAYSLMVTPSENNAGAEMTINLQAGKHYIFQLDVDMDDLPANSSLTFAILDASMNVVDSHIINSSQNINRQFLATATADYKVRVTINNFTGSTIAPFYLDNYYVYSIPANGQDFVSFFARRSCT